MIRKLFCAIALLTAAFSAAAPDNTGDKRKKSFNDDNDFLTYVQRQYFNYIWEGALPNSGLSRVRMIQDDPQRDLHTITVGSSGFGIAGISFLIGYILKLFTGADV